MEIDFRESLLRETQSLKMSTKLCEMKFSGTGGGITLNGIQQSKKRYLIGTIEILEEHSVAMMLRFYESNVSKERITMRFGLLPNLKTVVCFDLDLLDARTIYMNRTPGLLKLVVHGNRTDLSEIDKVELGIEKTFHDVKVRMSDFYLSDEKPDTYPLPDTKFVDEFGQWKAKEWEGKIHSFEEMKARMQEQEGLAVYLLLIGIIGVVIEVEN